MHFIRENEIKGLAARQAETDLTEMRQVLTHLGTGFCGAFHGHLGIDWSSYQLVWYVHHWLD